MPSLKRLKLNSQRGGAPGQGLHSGAGVAHTVPPLHPLPAPQAQAGQKLQVGGFLHFGELRIFQLVPSPPGSGRTKSTNWRISSLRRIADFSTHFQSLVYSQRSAYDGKPLAQ